jgi:hypothetical protein
MFRQIRSDEAVVPARADEAYGSGVSLGGRILTFGQDNLRFNLNYGNAIGRYVGLNAFNDGSIDEQGDIELSEIAGGFLAYQHWWNAKLRSTVSYSRLEADQDRVPDSVTEWVESLHANLLFSPLLQATFGLEYIHARRVLEGGDDGELDRVEFSAIHTF